MSRNRSYCISRKSERKSSSNVEGSDQDGITYHRHLGFRSDNSLESTSLGIHVQSSNKIALEKNDREYQNTNPDASLLATNTEETDDALGRELLEARFEAPMDSKNKTKEQENMSDNSDTDYDEKLSDKESEEAEKKTEECQVPDVDSQTSMDRSLNLQNEEKEEPSRLFGLDNKDTDEGEMQSADHLNEVSSPEVTMLLNLDDRQEGNSYTEREIYETQLLQLQRQLVETMMKEQEATEKLTTLENLKLDAVLKELEEEKAKTSELTARLEFMKNKMKNSPLKRANASRRRRSRNVETNESQEERPFGYDGERVKDDNHQDKPDDVTFIPADDTVFSFDEGHFAVASDTTCENETAPPSKFAKLQEYKHVIIETIIDRLGDFVNEDSGISKHKDDDDGDALSVITLKENINRCKSGAKPITLFVEPVIDILTWSSPVASIMTFLVYMFAVVHGYLLSLAILLVILQLSSNYFYASGLADKLGFKWKEEPPPYDDKKLSDRFQLVLQVAKKVQNALGEVADSLEKIKTLLMWQHPVTKKLFIVLCVGFVVSVLLDGATLFMLAGVGTGVKLFIVRPIYSKFPKVKKRYDNLARIWAELPTDTDLAKDAKHEKEEFYFNADAKDGPASPGSPKFGSPNFVTSWANLCVRMKIPLTEYPVPSWEEGHRCTLMTKDKPLAKLKHGKLFLTQNYLCFERYKFGASKNVIIKLKDTISVDKYKPMNIMPGTGMSIKVEFKGSYKPYIFGGLLTLDELYDSLIATCKAAKVPWAC